MAAVVTALVMEQQSQRDPSSHPNGSVAGEQIRNGIPDVTEALEALARSARENNGVVQVVAPRKPNTIRDMLRSWRRTSELKMDVTLIREGSPEFMQVDHLLRDKYDEFIERCLKSDWFENCFGEKQLSISLASARPSQSPSTPSGTLSPTHICITGLTDQKDITACHALLSRKRIRNVYNGLELCFRPTPVKFLAAEEFALDSSFDKGATTLCGSLIRSSISNRISTLGGLIRVDGVLCALTSFHEGQERRDSEGSKAASDSSVKALLDAAVVADEFGSDFRPALVVDSWQTFDAIKSVPEPSQSPRSSAPSEEPPVVGQALKSGHDWTLVEVQDPRFKLPNIDPQTAGYITRIQRRPVQSVVHILAGRTGSCMGIVSTTQSHLKTGYKVWTKVFTVYFNVAEGVTPLQQGDSGSWVISAVDGSLIGQIIAISNSMAYVMPALSVVDDIQAAFPHSVIGLPAPFDLLADLAHYYSSSKAESSIGKASKFAGLSVSLPILRASSDSPEDLVPRITDQPSSAVVLRRAYDSEVWQHSLLEDLIQSTGSNLQPILLNPESWVEKTGRHEFINLLNALKAVWLEVQRPAHSTAQSVAIAELVSTSNGVDSIESSNDTAKRAASAKQEDNENQDSDPKERKTHRQRPRDNTARVQNMANVSRRLLEDNRDALIDNPLTHLSDYELTKRVNVRFRRWGFSKYRLDRRVFQHGARAARSADEYASIGELTDEEKEIFHLESTATFWDEVNIRAPVALCCLAAVILGWTQASMNTANLYFPASFGMDVTHRDKWLFAAQNAASSLSGALLGCWGSDVLNKMLYGRRGTIFVASWLCLVPIVAGSFASSMYSFLICQILLGLGTGLMASVVPIYAAENVPARLRGRIVASWHVFTVLGAAISFSASLIFATLKNKDIAWRLMIGSGIIPTLPLLALVFACPESPSFLMKRGLYYECYAALLQLRGSPIAAAREMVYLDAQLEAADAKLLAFSWTRERPDQERPDLERLANLVLTQREADDNSSRNSSYADEAVYNVEDEWFQKPRGFKQRLKAWWKRLRNGGQPSEGLDLFLEAVKSTNVLSRIWNLFRLVRCRRALLSAAIVMIAQQLSGISVFTFYSSIIFKNNSSPPGVNNSRSLTPLWYSWGFGMADFIFSIPVFYLIDRKGRRWLLLWALPSMAILIMAAGLAYKIPEGLKAYGVVSYAFVLCFTAIHSVGPGPVPFVYSAEIFPLSNREVGMSFAVFCNFLGAGLTALLVPQFLHSLTPLLLVFAGLSLLAWIFVFLFVPETKARTLEELNYVFGVPTASHARYHILKVAPYNLKRLKSKFISSNHPEAVAPFQLYRWYSDVQDRPKGS